MDRHVIFGVHLTNRLTHASRVQEVFTEFGEHIKTRLGLHDVGPHGSSPSGVIVLDVTGDDPVLDRMAERLAAIDGVEVQRMVFTH
ncbi:MAG: hypothetical protein LAO05_13480 [Acidobacteriia bacterium]|nr:hypothetical protein [Terriglobia bacterium]